MKRKVLLKILEEAKVLDESYCQAFTAFTWFDNKIDTALIRHIAEDHDDLQAAKLYLAMREFDEYAVNICASVFEHAKHPIMQETLDVIKDAKHEAEAARAIVARIERRDAASGDLFFTDTGACQTHH